MNECITSYPCNIRPNKQLMSGDFPPMPLDYTICTEMFSSGAAIGGTETTRAHQLTEAPGKLARIITECCVVAPRTTSRFVAEATFVLTVVRPSAACFSSPVFELLWFPRSLWFLEDLNMKLAQAQALAEIDLQNSRFTLATGKESES